MSLICSISNEVPEEPVLSLASGCVFDKRLLEKYVAENGSDPVNGVEMKMDQIVPIKSNPIVKPRPPTATSIPAILKMLQDEWDACMLQNFTLRQQLQTSRQELSHALYQHDAACRVIARLNKEVTAAREALATLKPQAVNAPMGDQSYQMEASEAMDQGTEEVGMTEEVVKKLQDKASVLTSNRKQRGKTGPEGLVKADELKEFKQTASHVGLHSASNPGITALDVQAKDHRMVVTGGNDKNAVVFNTETEQIVTVFKGHQKKVSHVIFHPTEDICITSSPDMSVRVWNVGESSAAHVLKAHEGSVTGISLHATGDYLLSVASDEKWAFSDIRSGRVICKVSDPTSPQPMSCAQFHPDGLIFGVGTQDAMVKIWDLKEQANVANFPGHSGAVQAISFSENGYYLATAAEDSSVKLWDLRKLKNFKTINLPSGYQVQDLSFDQSGTYLAVAGKDVRLYLCKQWQELCTFTEHTDAATGVRFGGNAKFVASVGLDRALRIYS